MPLFNKKNKFNIFGGSDVGLPKLSPVSPRSKFTSGNQSVASTSDLQQTKPVVQSVNNETSVDQTKKEPFIGNVAATDQREKFVANTTKAITGDVKTPSGATVNVESGALVSPAIDPATKRFEDSREAFIRSLTPTAQEGQAQTQLNRLITQSQQASDIAGRSGETIGFARGRQAQVNLANQRSIDAAERRLGAITGQRETRTEGARELLRLDEGGLPEAPKPLDPFTLSPGQTRFDAQGNIVASGGARLQTDAEIQRSIDTSSATAEAKSSASNTVNAISSILALEDSIGGISGALRTTIGNKELANRFLSLQSLLTLPNLDKLKGSMSDKDLEFVKAAASVINPSIDEKGKSNLPTDVLIQELKNIRGIFQLQAGVSPTVLIFDPASGETERFTDVSREEVDSWFAEGLLVDFE